MTVTTLTTINSNDYNTDVNLIEDILGLGENGWGLPLISSNPTPSGRKIYASSYNNLLKDINVAHLHITNASSSTVAATSSTTIRANYTNELSDIVNWLYDDTRRYTCHPQQYFRINKAGGGTTSTLIASSATSIRTYSWGANDTTQISHEVTCRFRSRLAARYYFNQGNYLSWSPFYTTGFINDLDAEWATFIDYLAVNGVVHYGREEYITGDSLVEYTSGTLYVSVYANRSDDEAAVDFKILYGNVATPNLLITPAVGVYNIIL